MKRTLLIVGAATLTFGTVGALGGTARADVNQTIEIIDRPLTLPARTLELAAALTVVRHPGFSPVPGGPAMDGFTSTGLSFGLGYGFTPDLEGRIAYGIGLDPSTGKGPLALGVAYSLVHVGSFQAAFDLVTGVDVGRESLLPLAVGLEARIKLTSQLALLTPGHQLVFELEANGTGRAIHLDLPVALGYQAARNIFLDVQTNLARIALKDSDTQVWGSDMIPITLEMFYSLSNALDLGFAVSDDLKNAGDTYALGFLVRLFI